MSQLHPKVDIDDAEDRDGASYGETQTTRDAPLPAPVRKARYTVGGILVLVIALVVGFTYRRIEQQLQLTVERQLDAILNENVHAALLWVKGREALARRIAADPNVRAALRADRSSDLDEPQGALELHGIAPLLKLALDPEEGARFEWVRSFASRGDENKARNAVPPRAWDRLEATGSALWVERRGAKREIHAASLILDQAGETQGLLDIVSPSEALALHLGKAQEGRSGKTYVFDDGGGFLSSGAPSEPGRGSDKFVELHRRAKSEDSTDEYTSFRGVPVVGSVAWLDEYDFGIATEIERKKAYGSIATLRQSFLTLITLVGSALLGFLALGRWTLRVREESVLMTRRLSRLARAIQPLSAALEHDPAAVVLVDSDGIVVYANAASHRVLGVSETLLGQDAETVFENLRDELKEALVSGQDTIVAQGTDNDGETLLISSRNLSIDRNPHALYMLRPITQQVRRQEIEHWKKLIRVLSHELNNALAPITSLLSSARKVNQMSHQDPRLGEIFESIAERTRHLVAFLEGYREVARLPSPAPRLVPWDSFVQGLASQKSFHLKGVPPESPGYFDPVQLERVLINLLNNALEADSPAKDIEVEITEAPGGHVIEVRDRGTGMPEAVLKQAMLPFFSTKRTGTGVGLALSREIVEAHGGHLSLANREGGGLTVSCYLPEPVQPPSRGSLSRVALLGKTPDEAST